MTNTMARRLTQEERDRVRMSPIGLLSVASNGRFRAAPHQELMSFVGQLAVHASRHPELPSRFRNVAVAMPPRFGKTISLHGIASWSLGTYARVGYKVIAASYGYEFATSNLGYPIKNLMADLGPGAWNLEIDPQKSSASSFGFIDGKTRRVLGDTYFVSTAPGSELLGLGMDLGIADDLTKNAQEALSRTSQAKMWEWWQTTFTTRREQAGASSRMIVGQRWTDNDPFGRVLREEGLYDQGGAWTPIVLPHRATLITDRHIPNLLRPMPDFLGRAEGEYLWESKFGGIEYHAQIETGMDAHWYESMYGQAPTLATGIFQSEDQGYFQIVGGGTKYRIVTGVGPDEVIPVAACRRFMTCDLASSLATRADESVFATWDLTPSGKTLLVGLVHGRYEGPRAQQVLETTWAMQEPRPSVVWIESDALQIGWVQAMRGRVPVDPKGFRSRDYGDKLGRAETAGTVIAAGNLLLPQGSPITRTVTDALWSFPMAQHDDIVDVVSMAAILSLKAVGAMSGKPENMVRLVS